MPRRNLAWLILVAVASLVCYTKVPGNQYGRVLGDTLDRVWRRYYVPVKDQQLFEGAMNGMIGQLDKNSAYISPTNQQEFEEAITQQFGGVGMNVAQDPKTKQLVVISPLPGTPAFEAGIRPGDAILKIDGHNTQGMSLKDAVERMRGKPDTAVALSILHEGESQPSEITIVRNVIPLDTVQGEGRNADGSWNFLLPGRHGIGYLRITAFAEGERTDEAGKKDKTTVADLKEAIQGLLEYGLPGLVLDLRDNPGGSLKAAIETCDLFISSGVIVTTRGRDGQILKSFQASGTAPFTDFPIALLINQHSASASEIVAACLQDHHRAVIVGQQSFGKGTVQEVMDLGDGFGTLKLTIATYWRPSGRNIHRHPDDDKNATWGVMPDPGYQVLVDDEELTRFHQWRQQRDVARLSPSKVPSPGGEALKSFVDRPLAKALEYFEKSATAKK